MRRALLSLLTVLLLVASAPQVRADEPPAEPPTLAAYIRDPSPIAPPAAPGEPWRVEVSVYSTSDETVPATVTVILDPRLRLDGYAALGQAGGRVVCAPGGPLACVIPVRRWAEGYLVLTVSTAEDVWPCGPLTIAADVAAPGLAPAVVTRDRAIVGAEHCRAFPYTEGP